MSLQLINDDLAELDRLKKISRSRRETIVREAFKDLLKAWGRQQGLVFVAECPVTTPMKTQIVTDGALLHELRMPLGYWEAKDERDDLHAEIAAKFKKGYPQDNIVLTDDIHAVLVQNRETAADDGRIVVDSETTLNGIPAAAWRYQLGSRCALECVLDQYKEKKPKDPTIRALFDTDRYADYKEKVVDLLARVTTVSVRTVAITDAMRDAPR